MALRGCCPLFSLLKETLRVPQLPPTSASRFQAAARHQQLSSGRVRSWRTPGRSIMCEASLGTFLFCVIVFISPVVSPSVPPCAYSAGRSRCGATSLRHILLLGQVGSVPFWESLYFHSCLVLPSSWDLEPRVLASCASIHPARPSLRALSCRR